MTTDEIIEKMARFDIDVRDRIDELMAIEARVDERVKDLKVLHNQSLKEYRVREATFKDEINIMQEMLKKFRRQHDEIIDTISTSKDFVLWSRRVLISGVAIALAVVACSGYSAYRYQGYVSDAQVELAELEAQITKTPVIHQNEKGVDMVRVKTNKDGKVRWSNAGKHKGAYAEIEYAK